MDYDIYAAFKRIEDILLSSMVSSMKSHKVDEIEQGFEWTQWQAQQLAALNNFKLDFAKKQDGIFLEINENLEKAIKAANEKGMSSEQINILNAIKNGYKKTSKVTPLTAATHIKTNAKQLNALVNATKNDMQKAEYSILRKHDDNVRKVIFNAQTYATSGATYEKAVDMATKDYISAGINNVVYKNGRTVNIKSYADMALKTSKKRAYIQGEGEKRQEYGVTTVIINRRTDACPKCMPWEGKILIDDVYSGGSAADGDYPLLSEAIDAGLYHPNCLDSHTTYFAGVSTPPDENKRSTDEENEVAQNYEKKQKTVYYQKQAEKYENLSKYSLDNSNQKEYNKRMFEFSNKT